MQTLEDIGALRRALTAARREGRVIGFVPTMGFLHEGHLSLMRAARAECDVVVVSIFVNPTQFGTGEDLESYPRDLEADARAAASAGVDWLFTPAAEVIYPTARTLTWVEVEELSSPLCGRSRPEHFRGVTTVVARLFNLVQPDRAYFGEKDHQQLAIIRRMTRELLWPIEIVGCPILREADGLAMSSRNVYLSADGRRVASSLSAALRAARALFAAGERDAARLGSDARARLEAQEGVEVDYLEVVDPETLEALGGALGGEALMAGAIRVEGTRLIDNLRLDLPGDEERGGSP